MNRLRPFLYIMLAFVGMCSCRPDTSKAHSHDAVEDEEAYFQRANIVGEVPVNQRVKVPDGVADTVVRYPGFTVSYNKEHHQPNYVAWELTRAEAQSTKHVRGSRQFRRDMGVEGCADPGAYRGSGMSRGHMAPAGDMRWSAKAMEASFMMTNVCPQLSALNAGAWNSLEEKCRQWAVRDSAIVVICGPILSDRITRHIGDSISVPERFFKIVYSPFVDPPQAIGFIMPNEKVSGGLQTTAVSVDEIEAVTGFDFFYLLPEDLQEKIESQCHYPRWNRHKR